MDVRCAECAAMMRTDDANDGGVTDELLLPCEFCCKKEVEPQNVRGQTNTNCMNMVRSSLNAFRRLLKH